MFAINQNLIDDFTDKINEKEKKSNKVTSLSSLSTNVEYPSAKTVYDTIEDERIYNVKKEFAGQIENTFYYKHYIDYYNYYEYQYPELLGEAELSINITTPLANGEGFLIGGFDCTYSFISNGTNIIFSNRSDEYEIDPSFTIPNTNTILNFKVVPDETYPDRKVILFTCISNNDIIGQYVIDDYDSYSNALWYDGVNISLAGTYKYTLDFYNKYELKTSTELLYDDFDEFYRKSGTYIEYDITFNQDGDTFESDGFNESSPSFTYDDGKIIANNVYNSAFGETLTYELKTGNSCKIIEYVIDNNKKYLFDNAILCTIPYEENHIMWRVTNNEEPEADTELIATIYQPIRTKYVSDLDNDAQYLSSYYIEDNLTSSDSWKVLSAKQGKILNDNKLNKSQTSYKGKNVVVDATTGNITFEDKPTIPTKTSDLTNDSGFLTSHQSLSGYLQTSDVKNNLTSTDIDKPLSANQGKELKALIDNKEDNIYRIVGTEASSISSSSARLHCGTFPFDNINSRLIVYVVPDISTLSESQRAIIYGSYPSGGTISHNIFKSNNEYLTIGDIQTGDELLLMHEDKWRVISNSSISNKEDKSNKSSSITTDTGSTTKYPTVKAVEDYAQPIGNYLTSHQDISGKLDKAQTSYKGKNVVVDSTSGNITFEDKPTIPSASSTIPSADTTNGAIGLGTTWAKADHQHPKSSIYAEASHSHTKSEISDFPTLANVATSGSYADLSNKPTLSSLGGTVTVEEQQTAESGFTKTYVIKQNGSQVGSKINIPKDFLVKSATVQTVTTANTPVNGYVSGDKYLDFIINSKDGTATDEHLYVLVSDLVDTEIDWANVQNKPTIPSKTSDLTNDSHFISTSNTAGLIKNDGSIDQSTYLTQHQDISGKIDTAGTGLSKSGTTLNHSNSITALTTASFKKVKYDSQGHITGTSDVGASDLPSHNHTKSQITDFPTIPSKTSDLTNDSGFLTSHQDITGKEDKSNKVTSWSNTPTDVHYPSEKLVKDSLDLKANTSSLSTVATTGDYEDLLNLPEEICITDFYYDATSDELVLNTCTNNDISTITSKEDKSNKVTSWSATPTHSHYPSEKLVKDYIDEMIGNIIDYIEG